MSTPNYLRTVFTHLATVSLLTAFKYFIWFGRTDKQLRLLISQAIVALNVFLQIIRDNDLLLPK